MVSKCSFDSPQPEIVLNQLARVRNLSFDRSQAEPRRSNDEVSRGQQQTADGNILVDALKLDLNVLQKWLHYNQFKQMDSSSMVVDL